MKTSLDASPSTLRPLLLLLLCTAACGESHSPATSDATADAGTTVNAERTLERFFALYDTLIREYCECAPCSDPVDRPGSPFRECLYSAAREHDSTIVAYFGHFAEYLEEALACYGSASCRDTVHGDCTADAPAALRSAPPADLLEAVRECGGGALTRAEDVVASYHEASEERWDVYCRCVGCSGGSPVPSEQEQACMTSSVYLGPREFEDFSESMLEYNRDMLACYEETGCAELTESTCRLPMPDVATRPNPNVRTSLSRCTDP